MEWTQEACRRQNQAMMLFGLGEGDEGDDDFGAPQVKNEGIGVAGVEAELQNMEVETEHVGDHAGVTLELRLPLGSLQISI